MRLPYIWMGSSVEFHHFISLVIHCCTFCRKIFLFHLAKYFIDVISHHLADSMWSFCVLKEVAASSALRSLLIFIFQSPPFVLNLLSWQRAYTSISSMYLIALNINRCLVTLTEPNLNMWTFVFNFPDKHRLIIEKKKYIYMLYCCQELGKFFKLNCLPFSNIMLQYLPVCTELRIRISIQFKSQK